LSETWRSRTGSCGTPSGWESIPALTTRCSIM
jgi:hypothetical protein